METTLEQIEARKEKTATRRQEIRERNATRRKQDKEIIQKLHENRSNYEIWSKPYSDVTFLMCKSQDDTDDTYTVFWTIKNPNDIFSMKLAKLSLGRYMEENNQNHQFKFRHYGDFSLDNAKFVAWLAFCSKALSGEIQVSNRFLKWLTWSEG